MDDSMDSILDEACRQFEENDSSNEFNWSGDEILRHMPSQFFKPQQLAEDNSGIFDDEGDEIIAGIQIGMDPFDSDGDEIVAAVQLSPPQLEEDTIEELSLMDLSGEY
jgi:hypothetical protein